LCLGDGKRTCLVVLSGHRRRFSSARRLARPGTWCPVCFVFRNLHRCRRSSDRPSVVCCPVACPARPSRASGSLDQRLVHPVAVWIACPPPACLATLPVEAAHPASGSPPWTVACSVAVPSPAL